MNPASHWSDLAFVVIPGALICLYAAWDMWKTHQWRKLAPKRHRGDRW